MGDESVFYTIFSELWKMRSVMEEGENEKKGVDLTECRVKMVQWMAVSSKGIISSLWKFVLLCTLIFKCKVIDSTKNYIYLYNI